MTDFRQTLINKINHEYLEFKSQIISQDKISIFDKARKIDIYNDIYGYLTSTVFPSSVTEYLCGISPLLEITYLNWISYQYDYDNIESFLNDKILNMDKRYA